MDFKIAEYKLPDAIQFNFEELKAQLTEKTEAYKHMVYTDGDIKTAKADRAELNRLKKALNDERLNRQKEYMKPFDAFKKQVDEIIAIIDVPVKIIDEQVKAFESKVREEKEHEVRELFGSINPFDWLVFDQVFDTKWLNASASMGSIKSDMEVILAGIQTNLAALKGLEYEFEATEYYKRTLSLADAVGENKRLIDLAVKRAEMEQAKAEVKPEEKAFIEVSPVEIRPSAPKEWVDLKVNITEYEYDALTAWLDEQGIDWRIV